MANQDSKNFVENVVNAQKQAADTIVENTKKFTNGNTLVNETIQKGNDWYKNWLEGQKSVFSQTADKATTATTDAQDNMSKMNEFYQNWFNTQMGWAKQMWEMNLNHAKGMNNTATDPMTQWTNMWNNMGSNMNNMSSWMNNMNQANNWMNSMNQMKDTFSADGMKKTYDNWTGIFNQYYEMLNSNVADWQKNMQNGTTQDAYRNMVNVGEGFTRFAEMWAPLWKSIQDKTFNTEMYKQMMNPAAYKEVMDKYFGFMPENSREYMKNMSNMMQNGFSQMNQSGMGQYQQMRDMMGNMMPSSADTFGQMLSGYNSWYTMLNNSVAPITKMMTPNKYTKSMAEWSDIANRLVVYNIKNAEMQYMVYNQGTKVMDNLAQNIAGKIEKGEEITNIMALYQEWLNLSDKTYVSLFDSEEYSQIMAEVSAMQMTLKKDVEKQMEFFMVGVPVATRSEMDEMYKTIYDLKKQVRELEKAAGVAAETEEVAKEKATATRTKKA